MSLLPAYLAVIGQRGFDPASLSPLAYYDASNASCYPGSGSTVFDLSPNANDGTLTNGAAYSSSDGGVFALDGTDDFIDIAAFGSGAKLSGKTAFSVAFFVKQLTDQGAYFSYGQAAASITDILLTRLTDGNLLAQVNNGTDGSGQFAFALPSGYFHVVMVYDGSQTGNANRLKVYLNNVQQSLTYDYTVPSSTASPASPQSRVGSYYSFPTGFYMAGNIASGLVFDRAITAAEIGKIYNQGKGRLGL